MILIPFAIVAGILIALIRDGGFAALRSLRIRWAPLLVAGAALTVLADLAPIPGAIGLLIVGLLMLLAGVAANFHLAGAITLGIGILLNTVVMVVNAHIPVRLESLVSSGEVGAGDLSPDLSSVRQLEDADTRLAFLGDIVPIGILNTVVSFGDLIASAGVIVLVFRLLTRKTGMVDINDLFGEAEIDLREPQVRRTQPGRADRSTPRATVQAPEPAAARNQRGQRPGYDQLEAQSHNSAGRVGRTVQPTNRTPPRR